MPTAPDGDDEELDIVDVDIEGPPPPPAPAEPRVDARPEPVAREDTDRTQPGMADEAESPPDPAAAELLDIVDVVELRPPIVEAADDDARAEIELYRGEAAAGDGARRAGLLGEVARLEERLGHEEDNPAGEE